MITDILLSWSGGKDSALALWEVTRTRKYRIRALLTTLTEGFDRISMHGVRRSLLHLQASSLGLPLEEIWIPQDCSNQTYEARMRATLARYKEMDVDQVAFGDLFLRDIRDYRESRLAQVGMRGLFPIWGKETGKLARELIELGFRAKICCIDPRKLEGRFCGTEYDDTFLSSIPSTVDPCGENGEFHTFVYAGPIFKNEIRVKRGETVLRDGFYFTDLMDQG